MGKPEPAHRMTVQDRGVGHRFRFTPACTCGKWSGHPSATRGDAANDWRRHKESAQAQASRARRRHRQAEPGPRPITPHDQLPEALQ